MRQSLVDICCTLIEPNTAAPVQGGLRLTAGAFFGNWAATMLVTLVAQTFGLLVGATVMDAKTSQTVTAVIMLTMMLVSALCLATV